MERRIIHIDMDCFYAAVEERERPELAGKPLAVGGRSRRGVLTTCNYPARRFGVRSAMPTWKALELCPDLRVLPVRMELYREASQKVRAILQRYTPIIEPLSLDEAYLDVSDRLRPAREIAEEIRLRIRQETELTASAGVAPNKLLAKIGSDWQKPDGCFEITPPEVPGFVEPLPVSRLWGVGPRAVERLQGLGIRTCGDMQKLSLPELARLFGKFGEELHGLCRGIDNRPVQPHRERKSMSCEHTFSEDLPSEEACAEALAPLIEELHADLAKKAPRNIKSLFVKLKFNDFRQTTAEEAAARIDPTQARHLIATAWARGAGRPVRLIGIGVRFHPAESAQAELPLS